MVDFEKAMDPALRPFMLFCFEVAGMGILVGWFFDTLLGKLGFNPEKYRGVPLLISPILLTPIIYLMMVGGSWAGAVFFALVFGELGTSVGPAFAILLNPPIRKGWNLLEKWITACDNWLESKMKE